MKEKKVVYTKQWLNRDEIEKIINNPEVNSRDRLLIMVCYFGALRITEALDSKKEDYIENNNEYYILLRKQKTDKKNWEKQPIPDFVYAEVKRYCVAYEVYDTDYVFSSNRSERLSYNMAYKITKKCARISGINKDISTHTFRRSMATFLLDNGFEIQEVSRYLRHKNLETTMTYLKISKSSLYKKMSEVVNKIR